jgi:hypothetical protein
VLKHAQIMNAPLSTKDTVAPVAPVAEDALVSYFP